MLEFTAPSPELTARTNWMHRELVRLGHPADAIVIQEFERDGSRDESLELVREHLRQAIIPPLKHIGKPRCDGGAA